MREYAELVKDLRELPHLLFVQLGYHEDVVYKAADAIEELLALAQNGASAIDTSNRLAQKVEELLAKDINAPNKWVSVKEWIPDEEGDYITVFADGSSCRNYLMVFQDGRKKWYHNETAAGGVKWWSVPPKEDA